MRCEDCGREIPKGQEIQRHSSGTPEHEPISPGLIGRESRQKTLWRISRLALTLVSKKYDNQNRAWRGKLAGGGRGALDNSPYHALAKK